MRGDFIDHLKVGNYLKAGKGVLGWVKIHFANLNILLSVGSAKKAWYKWTFSYYRKWQIRVWCQSCHIPPGTQTFMGPWKLCPDYFWGQGHCALLARLIKPRPLVVIEESRSAFAIVGKSYQIPSTDLCGFSYTLSAKLGAFCFLVWWGSFSSPVRGTEKWEKRME